MVIGLKILADYREKREKGNKNYLGRGALLIGTFIAFASQAILGLFIINRAINGTALITFIFLSGMVIAHILMVEEINFITFKLFFLILNQSIKTYKDFLFIKSEHMCPLND